MEKLTADELIRIYKEYDLDALEKIENNSANVVLIGETVQNGGELSKFLCKYSAFIDGYLVKRVNLYMATNVVIVDDPAQTEFTKEEMISRLTGNGKLNPSAYTSLISTCDANLVAQAVMEATDKIVAERNANGENVSKDDVIQEMLSKARGDGTSVFFDKHAKCNWILIYAGYRVTDKPKTLDDIPKEYFLDENFYNLIVKYAKEKMLVKVEEELAKIEKKFTFRKEEKIQAIKDQISKLEEKLLSIRMDVLKQEEQRLSTLNAKKEQLRKEAVSEKLEAERLAEQRRIAEEKAEAERRIAVLAEVKTRLSGVVDGV